MFGLADFFTASLAQTQPKLKMWHERAEQNPYPNIINTFLINFTL